MFERASRAMGNGPRSTIHGSRLTVYGLRLMLRYTAAVDLVQKADKFLVLPFTMFQLKKQLSRQPSAVSRQPSAVSRQPSAVSRQP